MLRKYGKTDRHSNSNLSFKMYFQWEQDVKTWLLFPLTQTSYVAGCKLEKCCLSWKHWTHLLRSQEAASCVQSISPLSSSRDTLSILGRNGKWKVLFLLGLAMLSNLHVPKAYFNLVSSWFTLRDCLHLPPRHASLPLIISWAMHHLCVL